MLKLKKKQEYTLTAKSANFSKLLIVTRTTIAFVTYVLIAVIRLVPIYLLDFTKSCRYEIACQTANE